MSFKVEKLENKLCPLYKVFETDTQNGIFINFPLQSNIVQVVYDSLDLFPDTVEFSKKFDTVKFITFSDKALNTRFSDSVYFRNILKNHLEKGDMELFALESIRFYKCAVASI